MKDLSIVKLRQQLEGNVQRLFMAAPAIICVLKGPQHVFELANEMYLMLIGKKDVLGREARQVLPELEGQGFFELLDNVYSTGVPFIGKEMFAQLDKGNGKLEEVYLNFSYQPTNNSEGEIDGIFVHGVDVTEQVLSRKKIEESETRFRNMVHQAPVAICVFRGENYVFELANKKYLQLLGKTSEQILNIPAFTAIPEAVNQGYEAIFDGVYKTGIPYIANELPITLIRNGNEETIYINFVYEPLYNEANEINGIMSIANNVTEQVEARRKIEISEAKYKSLIDAAPMGIGLFVGRDLILENANQKYKDIIGKGSGIEGKTLTEILPELTEHGQPYLKILDDIFITGKGYQSFADPVSIERDGKLQHEFYDINYVPFFDSDGSVYAILNIASDVTKQTQLNIKIVASEHRYHQMIFSSPFMIAILKGEDFILEIANDAILNQLGKGKDIIGLPYLKAVPELEEQGFGKVLREVYKTGIPYHAHEMPVKLLNNGKEVTNYYNFVYQVQRNANNEIEGIAIIATDVTSEAEYNKRVKESEENFRQLANDTPAFMFTADADTNVEFVNKQWLNFVGLTSEEGMGKAWEKITHPDDVESMSAIYTKAVTTLKPYQIEIRQRRPDGLYRWVLWNGIPRKNSEGEFAGMMGIGIDITTQKEVQEIVKESEKHFRQLADSMPQIVWTARPDGYLDYYNNRWYEFTGFDEEFGDQSWIPILHPDDVQLCIDTWYHSVQNGERYQVEYRFLDKFSGNYKWFLGKALPVRNADGNITKWFGSCTDIHDQKEATEKVQESEKQLKILKEQLDLSISAGNIGVWNFSVADDYLYWSKEQCNLYGIEEHEFGNTSSEFIKFVNENDIARINKEIEESYKSQQTDQTYQFRITRADGEERWLENRSRTRYDSEGNPEFVTGINVDITDEKLFSHNLETKVKERTEQLNEKNIELQNMNKELEAFTYISSHDLQEPLRKIQTFAGRITAIEKDNLSESAKDYFKRMNDAAERMRRLIQDLLAFSRVSTTERKFVLTNLNKIVEEVKEEFKEVLAEKRATIEINEMCQIKIIPFQFRQLMHNLVSNSLKFSRQDVPSRIIIKSITARGNKLNNENLLPQKKYCHIIVSDNGIGFEKQFKEKIFQVFQKLHGKEQYSGTGIGLAIVKKIIDNHNGIITADSKLGKGATFNIYLPL